MTASENFKIFDNSLPEIPDDPIKVLSVISPSADFADVILDHLHRSYHYVLDTDQPLKILEYLVQCGAKYFSVHAESGKNTISFSAKDSGVIHIRLSRHTYYHHNYAGRYIKFKSIKPSKSSFKLDEYFSATVEFSSDCCSKDLLALISEAFPLVSMRIFSDISLEECSYVSASNATNVHKKSAQAISNVSISANVQSIRLPCSPIITPEDSYEVYEYVSLLHLNPNLDVTDARVRATSMYEIPSIVLNGGEAFDTLHLHMVTNVCPTLFYDLVNRQESISVQATTQSTSYLTISLDGNINCWQAKR